MIWTLIKDGSERKTNGVLAAFWLQPTSPTHGYRKKKRGMKQRIVGRRMGRGEEATRDPTVGR